MIAPTLRRCRPGLGTFVEIAILDDDAGPCAAAFDDAFAAIARVTRRMSFHDPASDLSAINRDADTRAVRVDPWTFEVLAAAADLFERSAGRFDCAIAPLLVERGFLPDNGWPDASPARGSFADVALDRRAQSVRFGAPLRLDLGGIAKGFAVDRAIDALASRGVRHAVVNAGGDLRVLGERSVAIHVRGIDDAPPIRVGELADGAFASSAGVRSRRHAPGALVDALARRVVDDARVYSVIAPTCLLADALTKVLASDGPDVAATIAAFGATALVH